MRREAKAKHRDEKKRRGTEGAGKGMIRIGYMGENNANRVKIDVTGFREKWPGSVASLFVTRPGEEGGTPYMADIVEDNEGRTVIWKVNSYDTEIPGHGLAQLVFTDTADAEAVIVGKSPVMDVYVLDSLEGTEEAEIPDPYVTWVETVSGYKAAAVAAAKDAEAWAKGTRDGTPVSSGDEAYQANAKYYATLSGSRSVAAMNHALVSEGYAKGTQNGTDVTDSSPYYHSNAKYYKEQASAKATSASNAAISADASAGYAEGFANSAANQALVSEGYATGKQNGTDVQSGTYYQNNAKFYASQASGSAEDAEDSADAAEDSALEAEGYATGKQNGADVSSGSPYYENNAKYYAGEAESSAAAAAASAGSITGIIATVAEVETYLGL